MSWPGLPVLVRVGGRPVILRGTGEAADAKRRLLERAGAVVVEDDPAAQLAVIAIEDAVEAHNAAELLKARGLLVNVVDRPAICDFTLPAIVDRAPLLVAVATGGASAGLAAAVRQRLEGLLPAGLGRLAEALKAARDATRARWPDGADRRRALAAALAPGGPLDPLDGEGDVARWLAGETSVDADRVVAIVLRSADPDDLTLREARLLAMADRVTHRADVPAAILERARADAARIQTAGPPAPGEGLTVDLSLAA